MREKWRCSLGFMNTAIQCTACRACIMTQELHMCWTLILGIHDIHQFLCGCFMETLVHGSVQPPLLMHLSVGQCVCRFCIAVRLGAWSLTVKVEVQTLRLFQCPLLLISYISALKSILFSLRTSKHIFKTLSCSPGVPNLLKSEGHLSDLVTSRGPQWAEGVGGRSMSALHMLGGYGHSPPYIMGLLILSAQAKGDGTGIKAHQTRR